MRVDSFPAADGGELIFPAAGGGELTLSIPQVEASFSSELQELRGKVEPLAEYQTTRQKLSAELADNSGVIRGLIVRAEDARLMGDL